MNTITPIKPGDRLNSAAKINEIIAALNKLILQTFGAGFMSRESSTGIAVAVIKPRKEVPDNFSGGVLKTLTCVQGSGDADTWNRDTDKKPVEVQVMTDIQYSNITHKIQARYRTFTYDRGGNLIKISAESDLVDITTAIACTAQL